MRLHTIRRCLRPRRAGSRHELARACTIPAILREQDGHARHQRVHMVWQPVSIGTTKQLLIDGYIVDKALNLRRRFSQAEQEPQ